MKYSHFLYLASVAWGALQIDYAGLGGDNTQYYKGMNIRSEQPIITSNDSGFKKYDDWDFAFGRLKNMTGDFNAVRIYSTQDALSTGGTVDHLESVFPLVLQHDLKLLIGIYLDQTANYSGQTRFDAEFAVLKNETSQWKDQGILDHIIGITVGNEDVYQGWTIPDVITSEITQVKNWLEHDMDDYCTPVGHTDTWNALTQNKTQPIVDASDFLVANIFPFWENVPINIAKDQFARAVGNLSVTSQTNKIPIWLGETGWPSDAGSAASKVPNAIASVQNMQTYWSDVGCEVLSNMNAFWYIDEDSGDSPNFGIWNDQPVIDFSCNGTKSPPWAAGNSSATTYGSNFTARR